MSIIKSIFLYIFLCMGSFTLSAATNISSNNLSTEIVVSNVLETFCYSQARTILRFAHPTSKFLGSSVQTYRDYALLTIEAKGIWGSYATMQVKVSVNSLGVINNVRIVRDDDDWPAFATISIIKELVDEQLQQMDNDEATSQAQQITQEILSKTYYQWDGADMCLFIMNAAWLNKGYHRYF